MMRRLQNLLSVILPIFVVGLSVALLSACDSGPGESSDGDDEGDIQVPTFYSFQSRFNDNSAVEYNRAVVHHLLVQDLGLQIEAAALSGASTTMSELLPRYTYSAPDSLNSGEDPLAILTMTTPDPSSETYAEFGPHPSLEEIVNEPLANQPVIGRGETVDALVRDYLARIAVNSIVDPTDSAAVYTTPAGVDMRQVLITVLEGALAYAQGAGGYLSTETLTAADNSEPIDDRATELEVAWDLAFGYFGASRHYPGFTDENLAEGQVVTDSDGDGAVQLDREYNYSFAELAGARDFSGTQVNYTRTIFEAFLRGRTMIANERAIEDILVERDEIRRAWEEVLAATAVHHINETLALMGTVTEAEFDQRSDAALNAHWSAAKGYSHALQFNPQRAISGGDLTELHRLLGKAPPYAFPDTSAAADSLRTNMQDAKGVLQDVYGFSNDNMFRW